MATTKTCFCIEDAKWDVIEAALVEETEELIKLEKRTTNLMEKIEGGDKEKELLLGEIETMKRNVTDTLDYLSTIQKCSEVESVAKKANKK